MRHSRKSSVHLSPLTAEDEASHDAMNAMSALASTIGHELRNPLAAIRSAHYFIHRYVSDKGIAAKQPRLPEFLDIVDRELTSCTKVITDLLDFSRDTPVNVSATPLSAVVRLAIADVAPPANVTIDNDVPASLPILMVDPDQLRRAIASLLQNAIEAIPRTRGGRVHATAAVENGEVMLRIEDDGRGVPPELKQHVLRPLFTTKVKGLGLGLAITQAIIDRHGGRLSFDSPPGKGATFVIALPLRATRTTQDATSPAGESGAE